MFEDFEITDVERLKDNAHERYEFTVNVQGNDFTGIYHDGKVQWYQPHPNLEENLLEAIETKVNNLMAGNQTHNDGEIEVKPLFEGQVHERHQFSLYIQGNEYQGVYHDEKIHWFHPQPENHLEEFHLENIENNVHEVMKDYSE